MRFRWACLALAAILGCSEIASSQQSGPASPARSFTFTQIDIELLEKCNQLDKLMEDRGMLYPDAALTEYVSAVGNDVLPPGANPEHVVWQFHVLRDSIPNAFALPNGSIYVNTGLLALLENEAQLASVLAHEETHVLNRHGYLENRSTRKKALAANIIAGVADAGAGVGGLAGGAAAVVGVAAPAIVVSTIYGYSRELEKEADVRAVAATNNANYSTEEMVVALQLLDSSHEVDPSARTFYQDHPKLKERIAYVRELADSTHSVTPHPMVEAKRYVAATEEVSRDNVAMDIREGRERTAVAVAQRLVKQNPESFQDYRALGDAWRALGPRTPDPTPEELSSQGKSAARKAEVKLTPQEYEAALMDSPAGKAAWEVSRKQSEDAYRQALALDPGNAAAHRGLGLLYEKEHMPERCAEEFQKYLQLEPDAPDGAQIRRRLEIAQRQTTPSQGAR